MKKFINVLFLGLVVAFVGVGCNKPAEDMTSPPASTNAPAAK